jgi:sugar lactone lactonase YvrE
MIFRASITALLLLLLFLTGERDSVAQNLLVANNDNSTITAIAPDGTVSTYATNVSMGDECLAFNASGLLYVASYATIYHLDTNGSVSVFAGGFDGVEGLAVDSKGWVLALSEATGSLYRITPYGIQTTLLSGMNHPTALAIDPSDNIFVAAGSIRKIASNGVVSTLLTNTGYVGAMACDKEGNLYAVNGNLKKINTDGTVSIVTTNIPSVCVGVAVDADENIYVTDGPYCNVYKITQSGTVTLFASRDNTQPSSQGLYFPSGLAFTPSPATAPFKQTIDLFRPIPNQIYGVLPLSITPPLASSGLPVTLSVLSGPATISNNMLTLTGTGEVILAADQPGNSNFLAADEVTTTFEVNSGGGVVGWGVNTTGQTTIPSGLSNAVQVTAGTYHAAALRSDGTVVAWGDNTYGQTTLPSGLTNVIQIAAGKFHTVALKSDGTVIAWGDNSQGQTTIPPGLTNVVQVAAGDYHAAALVSDGSVVLWGMMNFIHGNQPATSPVVLSDVVQIAAGGIETMTLQRDGSVYGWGLLGYGPNNSTLLTNVVQVATGYMEAAALLNDGSVISWTQSQTPPGVSNVVQVAAGWDHVVALKNDGSVISWGDNFNGQTTIPMWLTNAVQVAAGEDFSLALVVPTDQTISALPTIVTQTNGTSIPITLPSTTSGLPVTVTVKSGPANFASNSVTMTGSGTVVLAANQPGNGNYKAAAEVTTSFTVKSFNQTIAPFTIIVGSVPLGTVFTLIPPRASSGLPVTLSILSGPATISSNTITTIGAGTVTLAADQSGNGDYFAAPEVTLPITIGKGNQTITFKTLPTEPSTLNSLPLTATASSGLPVSYQVASGPASVSGNLLTLTGTGKVKITASQVGDTNYFPAKPITIEFQSKVKAPQHISFPPVGIQTLDHSPITITLPTASSGLQVTTTVASGPAKISGNQVTLTGVGAVVLRATQSGNGQYLPAPSVSTSFVVRRFSQTIAPFASIPTQAWYVNSHIVSITPPLSSSGLKVSVTVKSGPAKIVGNKVNLSGEGVVVLSAHQAGDAKYVAAPEVTTSFTVEYPPGGDEGGVVVFNGGGLSTSGTWNGGGFSAGGSIWINNQAQTSSQNFNFLGGLQIFSLLDAVH